jgi:hypothetical protein
MILPRLEPVSVPFPPPREASKSERRVLALAAAAIVASGLFVSAGLVTLAVRNNARSVISRPEPVLAPPSIAREPLAIPAVPREIPAARPLVVRTEPAAATPALETPHGRSFAPQRAQPIARAVTPTVRTVRAAPVARAVRAAPVANARPASCAERCHGDMECLMQCSVGR